MPERLSRRRRALFAAIAVALALVVAGAGLLAADLYVHHKYERVSAVNIWGYRGPVVGDKRRGETRIVVLGGSAAFGYGVSWDEAFPHLLEQRLQARGPYRVINLAFNNESAASFAPTLEDYRYLGYDVAILYEGYNDLLARPPADTFRRQSAVFNATGYLPLLPMVAREKYFEWRYRGDIGRGYQRGDEPQTVFRPKDGAAAEAAAASLDAQLGRLTPEGAGASADCAGEWQPYCAAVIGAVTGARAVGTLVMVATQPYVSDRHVEQQSALRRALDTAFAGDRGVVYLDLGRAVDLRDPALAYDGMHLTLAGNRVIAQAFEEPLLALLRAREVTP